MIRPNASRKIGAALFSIALLFAITAADDSHAAKKKRKSADSGQTVGKTKFDRGSAENPAQRDKRLLRECKGRPNSGACMGYTG
jgi:hypothetical protein